MKRVTTGITRTVFLTKRYAIKVPTGRGLYPNGFKGLLKGIATGYLANLSELEWSDWHKDKVAPVLFSFFGIVNIYPRCKVVAFGDKVVIPLLHPDPGDVKHDNYGIYKGRVVRLDYSIS